MTANAVELYQETFDLGEITRPPCVPPAGVVIHCVDSIAGMRDHLTDASVDLVITSPPYDVGIAYDAHSDTMPEGEYFAMLRSVWGECRRVLVPGGRIAVNVPHGVGRSPYRLRAPIIAVQLAELFDMAAVITWVKNTSGGRCSWGSWRSPSRPVIRDTSEIILIAEKPGRFVVPDEFLVRDGNHHVSPWLPADLFPKLTQDVWTFPPETQRRGHPAPFPVELPDRLIRLFGYRDCHVVDPFGGSGTTAVSAVNLGCRCTMFDVSPDYCELAADRCADTARYAPYRKY